MRIQILDRAERDLIEGSHFYESQGVGLGSYFLTNLYADIESLHIYAGIHSKPYKSYYRLLSVDSLSQFSTRLARTPFSSMRFWIAAAIRRGSANDFLDVASALLETHMLLRRAFLTIQALGR